LGSGYGGRFLGFGVLTFPDIHDICRRPVNHLDLPLLSQFLGIFPSPTNLITYLFDAVGLYDEFSDYFRVVL
jgi:hypothetical protein